MLIIVCGEDIISSRQFFQKLKDSYQLKGYQVSYVTFSQLPQIVKDLSINVSLFGQKNVFLSENLDKNFRRTDKISFDILDKISHSKELILIDWEEGKSQRELKIKKYGQIKEFKISISIFNLLDSCYPGNFKNFYLKLQSLLKTQNENLIFYMLRRHTRLLILAKLNQLPKSIPPWQRQKFIKQSNLWEEKKLLKFYDSFYRLDLLSKTGTSPYQLRSSLDILASYFL
ncbi:MAG: hypothetical protein QHH09_03875 [Microgenomates group bacterium]|nr:hypothetical protein [Microgenomates group bacterium]